MPLPVIPECLRVACESTFGGEVGVNVFHVEPLTPAAYAFSESIAEDIANAFSMLYGATTADAVNGPGLKDLRPDDAVLSRIVVTTLDDADHESFEFGFNLAGSGAASMPYSVALKVTFKTPTNTRRGRGGVYLGPWSTAASEDLSGTGANVRPRTTTITDVGDAMESLKTRLAAIDWRLSVMSSLDLASRRVTQFKTNDRWDSQRRRQKQQRHTMVDVRTV